ncbi:MAG: hypothetical protein CL946_09775 [Ectothiorhodospiraceae bacterium]|nr:hypothetical protein [Ectothiorhodospiraceae bacterium]
MKPSLRASLIAVLLCLPLLANAQTARTVLIEEFTGNWCGWCPYGADIIENLLQQYSDVRALAYHGGASEPLSTTEGLAFADSVYLGGYPTAAIDRVVWQVGGNYMYTISRPVWSQAVGIRRSGSAQTLSPMTISVSGTIDPTTRLMTVISKLDIVDIMQGDSDYRLNVVLSESGIQLQQYKYAPDGKSGQWLNPYTHKHVVRKMITGTHGKLLNAAALTIGATVYDTTTYTVPNGIDINNTELSVFVARHQSRFAEVQQAYQEPTLTALTVTPVELVSFYGFRMDDGVQLSWRTATESNNMGWYIERKTENSGFEEIGFVEGKGTSKMSHQYGYTDRDVENGMIYTYRLRQVDYNGGSDYSPKFTLNFIDTPETMALNQNFPNPVSEGTEISIDLTQDTELSIEVYDLMGRQVSTIAEGTYKAGRQYFFWTPYNIDGQKLTPGVYMYRLTAPGFTQTRQMQIVK